MTSTTPILSVVIPVHNEQDNVPVLVQQLTEVLTGYQPSYEIVFVDDGSNDETYDAKISIDAPGDFFSYGINRENRSTMKFTSLFTRQSFYGDGYVIEMTLKKK